MWVYRKKYLFVFVRGDRKKFNVNVAGRRLWTIPKNKKEIIDAERVETIWAWDESHARLRLTRRINYQSQRLGIRTYKQCQKQDINASISQDSH